jgi:hypothetical protein
MYWPYLWPVLRIFLTRTDHIFDLYCPYFLPVLPICINVYECSMVHKISIQFSWTNPSPSKHRCSKTQPSVMVEINCRSWFINFSSYFDRISQNERPQTSLKECEFCKIERHERPTVPGVLATIIGQYERNLVEAVCTWYSAVSVSVINIVTRRLTFACGRKSKYVCAILCNRTTFWQYREPWQRPWAAAVVVWSVSEQIPSATYVSLKGNIPVDLFLLTLERRN